jgi:glycerophosphoryl diester phosphodiesterase
MSVRLVAAAVIVLTGTLVLVPAAGANPWLERRVLTIAHQGGEDEFPSNTLYAFRRAVRAGADMLELDVGVTRDGQVVVSHDTTLDRTTDGSGTIASKTLAQIRRLDAAYWFAPGGDDAYAHDRPRSAYRFRGIATGRRRPPAGFTARDFRVPTLREVLRAFPRTPINIEVKGRTPAETTAEYVHNAERLARVLRGTARRDLIVVSFRQQAVTASTRSCPRSRSRRGSTARRTGCSPAGARGPASSRSSCRSRSPRASRRSRSRRRRPSPAPTARASRGTPGCPTTASRRRRGGG